MCILSPVTEWRGQIVQGFSVFWNSVPLHFPTVAWLEFSPCWLLLVPNFQGVRPIFLHHFAKCKKPWQTFGSSSHLYPKPPLREQNQWQYFFSLPEKSPHWRSSAPTHLCSLSCSISFMDTAMNEMQLQIWNHHDLLLPLELPVVIVFSLLDKHQPVKILYFNSNLNFSGSNLQPAIVLPLSDKSTVSPQHFLTGTTLIQWEVMFQAAFLIRSEFFQSLTAADGGDRLKVTTLAWAGGCS